MMNLLISLTYDMIAARYAFRGALPRPTNDQHGPLRNCPFCEHGLGPSAA